MTQERKIKIIIAKPGLDGHDRGAKVVARALRDAGFEVVYTGIRQTPEMIAETALQEDADVIGLSILSGAHLELFPRVVEELKKRGMDDVVLFGGGIIPHDDIPELEKLGFKGIFGPGSSTHDIIDWVRNNAPKRGAASSA
ncbi:MAG: cobalamin B12-binding domain-containing protein [Chloroflexi bacterium]|jgi:methylmalonyl-CoA mutase C-terminal domain/subunit|nr:MAG: cobalamin B12-binding domain-containing protein [Chloroflexota bacterium]